MEHILWNLLSCHRGFQALETRGLCPAGGTAPPALACDPSLPTHLTSPAIWKCRRHKGSNITTLSLSLSGSRGSGKSQRYICCSLGASPHFSRRRSLLQDRPAPLGWDSLRFLIPEGPPRRTPLVTLGPHQLLRGGLERLRLRPKKCRWKGKARKRSASFSISFFCSCFWSLQRFRRSIRRKLGSRAPHSSVAADWARSI